MQTRIKTQLGYRKIPVAKIYDKGNLVTMTQRMEVSVLEPTPEYPTRFSLKVGKADSKNEWSNKENAQEFRSSSMARIDQIIEALVEAKRWMIRLQDKQLRMRYGR